MLSNPGTIDATSLYSFFDNAEKRALALNPEIAKNKPKGEIKRTLN
jgi:hypothetical protein